MSKTLITGASGFVGINLVPYLQKKNLEVVPFSRINGSSYSVINHSFLDQEAIDTIVHLAGKAHDLRKSVDSQEYFKVNTELTIELFDQFLTSNAKHFIYISSIKAVADRTEEALTENMQAVPLTDYGKSKLAAEHYLLNKQLPTDKRVYVLRPCMIHGPGNKGNLNLLYQVVRKGIPYPLAAFDNKRSFLSVENLCFVIYELISRKDINSGIYHISDDDPVSTNHLIKIMADSLGKSARLIRVPKCLIRFIAVVGDRMPLLLNTEKLQKLTDNYLVNNTKLKGVLGKPLPVSAVEGLRRTIESFNHVA